MKHRKIILSTVAALVIMSMILGAANAIKLGDVLKVGGIIFVVDKYGKNINSFINKLLANNNLEIKESTKVVPILSIGEGGYVGACQVTGPKKVVEKCNCVVQYEDDTVLGSNIRVRALVPCETRSIKNVKRLKGIGISALVDIKI